MNKLNLKIMLIICLQIIAYSLFGQNGVIVLDSTATGTIKFALIDKSSELRKEENSIKFLKDVLNSDEQTDFYLYRTIKDELGYTHEAYQQIFKGIKVEFGEYIIHRDISGYITSFNGNLETIPDNFNINITMTFEESINRMSLKRNSVKYQILDLPESVRVPSDNSMKLRNGTNSQTELVIIKDPNGKFHLAYKVNLIGNSISDNFIGYIDSNTGDIITKTPLIYQTNSTGNAATRYSGSRTITTDSYSGKFRLQESNRSGTTTTIHTRNFNNADEKYKLTMENGIKNASDFFDDDNNWTSTEFNNIKKDDAALDAHWGSEMTFDYFLSEHYRKSYDNNNAVINSYVHVGTNYNNAFWSATYKAMFYGDGDGIIFSSPPVSLDVVAHEIGHGVCNSSVGNGTGLIYSGESGALNESLSDIWAACVENKYAPEKQIWIMGEEFYWLGGMRSMNDPKKYGDPDTYGGQYWANTNPSDMDHGGVHTNSGIGNYWFYLLSQGGKSINDLGNSYEVIGIGIQKAAKIVYRMETSFLNPNSNFYSAFIASTNASKELFGDSSPEVIAVHNAWYAVGVASYQMQNEYISGSDEIWQGKACTNYGCLYSLIVPPSMSSTIDYSKVQWKLNGVYSDNVTINPFRSPGNGEIVYGTVLLRVASHEGGTRFNSVFTLEAYIPETNITVKKEITGIPKYIDGYFYFPDDKSTTPKHTFFELQGAYPMRPTLELDLTDDQVGKPFDFFITHPDPARPGNTNAYSISSVEGNGGAWFNGFSRGYTSLFYRNSKSSFKIIYDGEMGVLTKTIIFRHGSGNQLMSVSYYSNYIEVSLDDIKTNTMNILNTNTEMQSSTYVNSKQTYKFEIIPVMGLFSIKKGSIKLDMSQIQQIDISTLRNGIYALVIYDSSNNIIHSEKFKK